MTRHDSLISWKELDAGIDVMEIGRHIKNYCPNIPGPEPESQLRTQ